MLFRTATVSKRQNDKMNIEIIGQIHRSGYRVSKIDLMKTKKPILALLTIGPVCQ